MTLFYSNPLNNLQKLQNLIIKCVIVIGYVLGFFPYKWNESEQKYFLRSKFHQILSVIAIVTVIISSLLSFYTYKNYLLSVFIDSKVDIILNSLGVFQYFTSIVIACLTSLLNRVKVLKTFNKILFLKKHILKLNKNPLLDARLFKLFLCRWVVGALIIVSISLVADEATTEIMDGYSNEILSLLVFAVQYTWYTASVTALLCCTLFASHLVQVITLDLIDTLRKLRWLNQLGNKMKPSHILFEHYKLIDRIDYLSFCHLEVIRFVYLLTSLAQFSLLGIILNIFTTIISNTGYIYVGVFWKGKLENEKSRVEVMNNVAFLWFAFNELYFINVGPQILLDRVSRLQKIVGSASTFVGKRDLHANKSVSLIDEHLL